MDRLPGDVLIDIWSRLPIKSLMRCRCVCKSWLSLTHDPRFTHTHLARSSQTNPNLILNGSIYCHCEMYFVEQDQTHDFTCTNVNFSVPDFKKLRVVGSCNGLLCLVHPRSKCMIYICNPFTGECIELPHPINPSQSPREMVLGFGFSSKTNEYKVVVIIPGSTGIRTGYSKVFLFTIGDESWRDMEDFPYSIIVTSSAFVNGALHWVCIFPVDLIVSFDVVDEVFGVIACPEFGQEKGCSSLGVLSGRLSITDSSFHDHVEIWVMEDYGVKESWTKRFAINFDRVGWNIRFSRTLCFQRDGKLLLLYNNQALVLYDPQTVRLRKLRIDGLPSWFEAVTHVASLVSPSGCLRRDRQL